ncbi:MAG: acyl transferase [Lewinellaceae bacterium]|nr:acyl transferase [Phaeodactylibacter sp.]MCB0615179.1 acyl transferase [Phaeodactylibacter sp.]MCB9349178.1 acyl transferase [Lewinellaceae bacterium]
MPQREKWVQFGDILRERVEKVAEADFQALALDVFFYQARNNPLYRQYLELLGVHPQEISLIEHIPFLPIQFFKNHEIQTGSWQPALSFSSSGTTAQTASRHLVRDPEFYRRNARRGFAHFYGPVEEYCVLALLPSYMERTGSSLVFMAEDFIRLSRYPQSGFFLYNTEALAEILSHCKKNAIPTILLGVSFALWEFAEQYPMGLSGVTLMETGGMKGRRRELTREELHLILQSSFQVDAVHSEYGMTELLSQAYSQGGGLFRPSPTMRVLSREITDPFAIQPPGKTGALNIIDLANLDTISFIATDDLGRVYEDGSFEILGRLDASDARGCNLLVADV